MKSLQQFPKAQHGFVLIIALLMLLLMTIVGLSSIRGSNLQEQMAGNMRDRQIAFQAAEAALREGEAKAYQVGTLDTSGVVKGQIPEVQSAGSATYWQENYAAYWNGSSANSIEASSDIPDVIHKPRYVIEHLVVLRVPDENCIDYKCQQGNDLIFYRITANGVGATPNTDVLLQTIFRKQ